MRVFWGRLSLLPTTYYYLLVIKKDSLIQTHCFKLCTRPQKTRLRRVFWGRVSLLPTIYIAIDTKLAIKKKLNSTVHTVLQYLYLLLWHLTRTQLTTCGTGITLPTTN